MRLVPLPDNQGSADSPSSFSSRWNSTETDSESNRFPKYVFQRFFNWQQYSCSKCVCVCVCARARARACRRAVLDVAVLGLVDAFCPQNMLTFREKFCLSMYLSVTECFGFLRVCQENS
jgi:hypothetical protein